MVLYGAAPSILGLGILGTSIYLRTAGLELPLWYSRKVFRYIVLAIFTLLFIGYLHLQRDMQMNEKRLVLGNIQEQLDTDRQMLSKEAQAQRQERLQKRKAEIDKLKDPFL